MFLRDLAGRMDEIAVAVSSGEAEMYYFGLEPGRVPKVVVNRIVVSGSRSR